MTQVTQADLSVEADTTCSECGKVMATAATLSRHMMRMHTVSVATVEIPVQREEGSRPLPPATRPPVVWPAPEGLAHQLVPAPASAKKPLWKKKRFVIPAGLLSLMVLIGAVSPTPTEDKPNAKASSNTQSTPAQAPGQTPEQKAEEARAAAAKAAADKAAAAKAAAAKAAADKAAARAAAVKAAAERAAAAKAAAEKAARERPVALTTRDFALLMKNPDNYIGRHYIVYGEVSQFDAATGNESFLADSGATRDPIEYGFTEYNDNTLYTGSAALLANVVEGDVFRATIEVLGSESYDTQIGGNTTVPKFRIQSISVYGSTK